MDRGLGGEVMASTASKASENIGYAAAAMNIYFGMTIQEWCLVIGALCGIGTFLVSWYYRRKDSRLARFVAARQIGVDVGTLEDV